jgi:hypothetical protein
MSTLDIYLDKTIYEAILQVIDNSPSDKKSTIRKRYVLIKKEISKYLHQKGDAVAVILDIADWEIIMNMLSDYFADEMLHLSNSDTHSLLFTAYDVIGNSLQFEQDDEDEDDDEES